ncbi:MAG: ATP-dependent 6-phosphofructokinase, partial [Dehalococcoidia bacterium]|nr:ATP-dependent 6-phosphofructokinase [Dehalococcoidia bacterium]
MPQRRIGVLTGGGDCPGLNAVIRAVVKTAYEEYDWDVIGIRNGFDGLFAPDNEGARRLTPNDVRGILPRGGTILGTANRGSPFARKVKLGNETKVVDQSDVAIARIEELQLDALIVIGGDGTLSIAHELALKGVPIIGVPKTIDNDLPGTDTTFGFDTAVVTATEALDRLHTTAESHHRVMVLEVMGRDAGWIALHAGIAGGADVILIPEINWTVEAVTEKINARDRSGRHFSLVIVAEGAKTESGEQFYIRAKDQFGPGQLGGIGNWVAEKLAQTSGHDTRCTVLGHVQRGGTPTPFDRVLSTRYGAAAVRLVAQNRTDQMVA